MWVYNNDFNKWYNSNDSISTDTFGYLKQELSSTRFYSKFLSGATFIPINSLDNIFDIIGEWTPKNWYMSILDSPYAVPNNPSKFPTPITDSSSYDYYTKFIKEYGLTLKNLFTSNRLIKDSLDNYIYVDVATTSELSLPNISTNLVVDSISLKKGHKLLVKNQTSQETLSNNIIPENYFKSKFTIIKDLGNTVTYSYLNNENGLYEYDGFNLNKLNDLDNYDKCIRFSVYVENGIVNAGRQFHLNRLLNGFFPTSLNSEPMEFSDKHNWILRNKVDYNNLFEINYYDVIKHDQQSYNLSGVTYSIPSRIISVGEFGIILNNQSGTSNIINNKVKVNLRSISQTTTHYWICGDDTTLLKVRKHDFFIESIKLNSLSNLKSISFFNDLRGVVVGDLNNILLTIDSGVTWKRLDISEFSSFTYNKVLFKDLNRFFIGGKNGVFIEVSESTNGWTAYRRRISKQIDDDDEHLLVENINDFSLYSSDSWNLSYDYISGTISNRKDFMFISTDNGNLISYDYNNLTEFNFLYLSFDEVNYGDIKNITQKGSSNEFYFTSDAGLYSFNLENYTKIGIGNSHSNSISGPTSSLVSNLYSNEIFDYKGESLIMCGNTSLLQSSTYSSNEFISIDSSFDSRLKSKMLFLDYDMASKLNFFTDSGEYRLPNSLKLNLDDYGNNVISYTYSSSVSQTISNNNNIDTTFNVTTEFKNKPIKEIKVKINLTHTWIGDLVIDLIAPNGKILNIKKKGSGTSKANLTNVTFSTNDNYLDFNSNNYPFDNKIFKLPKEQVTDFTELLQSEGGDWTIKISDSDSTDVGTLISCGLEFYESKSYLSFSEIINPSISPSYLTQSQNNWWSYWNDSQKTFEYYSNSPLDESSKVLMSSTFSFINSYKELVGLTVSNDINEIKYLAPTILESGKQSTRYYNTGSPLSISSNPIYNSPNKLYLYDYLVILETPTSWIGSVGDVIRLESDVIDCELVINKVLISATQSSTTQVPSRKFMYMYSEFNQNIINSLLSENITIKNLNYYNNDSKLISNFNLHPISKAYEINDLLNGDISISPKFNNITSYYNLGSIVDYSGVISTMSYTDGFLKFGYTPTYNILDYLESINYNSPSPTFYGDKEYFSMPVYKSIPIGDISSPNTISIEKDGIQQYGYKDALGTHSVSNDNKVIFGSDLKLEWESIFLNTFIDVSIYQPNYNSYLTEKLLVTKKYEDLNYKNLGIIVYVIEFQKSLNYKLGYTLVGGSIDIRSRRFLKEISNDLQEFNNIQKSNSKDSKYTSNGINIFSFKNNESELNFKVPTDSYAKILLSDVDTVNELSALMYIDYKNELSMNITRLDREFNIPISNTLNYNGSLHIKCSEKHDLKTGDGFVLEFNGGTYSSEYLNQEYFGYNFAKIIINEYDFITDIPYGNDVFVGNDTGYVKYIKKDPFLNYQPVDIIDIGLDKLSKVAVQLEVENIELVNNKFNLINVDFNRYRYRLVDGISIDDISSKYPWVLEAEIKEAVIGQDKNGLVWYKGIWESGRWFGGTWYSGTWKYGDWYEGLWESKNINDKLTSIDVDMKTVDSTKSTWVTGRWYDGTWNNGTWNNGRWYDGEFNGGVWNNGIWNYGTWNNGRFIGGIWVDGTWNSGIFNTDNELSFWLNGTWNSGDFENGVWYNGSFVEKNGESRFGTNSYNSRTSIWKGGKWVSGSFYSRLDNIDQVSDIHKYSIWETGNWLSGNWYGGVSYNMNFKSGTWHGGILEDIQIIGINSENNSFILNGIFRYNIGDQVHIIDNNSNNSYSKFGSNSLPIKYKILKTKIDETNSITEIYVDYDINIIDIDGYIKKSGVINEPITQVTTMAHTQSVSITSKNTNEIKVNLNLNQQFIGDLLINLKAPNGNIINLKEFTGDNLLNNKLIDTKFSTKSKPLSFNLSSTPYTNEYEMSKLIKVGSYKSNTNSITDLLNIDNSITGDWTLYISNNNNFTFNGSGTILNNTISIQGDLIGSLRIGDIISIQSLGNHEIISMSYFPGNTVLMISNSISDGQITRNISSYNVGELVSWDIEFISDSEIGSQINNPITNGFDTKLRIVSNFENSNWKSGIWSNGIYKSGVFEGGIWYNGVFEATWG